SPPSPGRAWTSDEDTTAASSRFAFSAQRGNAHGPPVAATAFKKIAILSVHGGVLYARKQQPVAVETAVLRVVLKQALGDLLVVRVVAEAAGGQRQLLHQRLAVGATSQIRPGPGHGLAS